MSADHYLLGQTLQTFYHNVLCPQLSCTRLSFADLGSAKATKTILVVAWPTGSYQRNPYRRDRARCQDLWPWP